MLLHTVGYNAFPCAVGKLDWYAQIRAYLDKEHPVFEYEYMAQRAYATKPYSTP